MRTAILGLLLASGTLAQPRVEGPLVIFIGPPGSGKSTQAASAGKTLGLPVVSAEMMMKAQPDVFEKNRRPQISGMEPQSDPAMNKVFASVIEKNDYRKGLILDGYPATKDHADYLAGLVKAGQLPAPVIIQLDVPDEIVRKRMAKEAGAALEQRIKDYHREFDVLQLYFPNADVNKLDGTKKAAQVEKTVATLLKSKLKK